MKLVRILGGAFAVLALSVTLAACGGGTSQADYQQQVQQIMNQVSKDNPALNSSSVPTADTLNQAKESIAAAADKLEAIDPPADIKDLHNQLVDDIRKLGEAMGKMAPIMESISKDPSSATDKLSEAQSLEQQVNDVIADLDKIRKDMEAKGYKWTDSDTSTNG